MPGMDRTGPNGMGPMTGGARGLCGGAPAGRGFFGRCGGGYARYGGRGGGYGRGMGYVNPPAQEGSQEAFLKAEASQLKNRLDFIQKELDNITVTEKTDESES